MVEWCGCSAALGSPRREQERVVERERVSASEQKEEHRFADIMRQRAAARA